MICNKCGYENTDSNAKFCNGCGTQLIKPQSQTDSGSIDKPKSLNIGLSLKPVNESAQRTAAAAETKQEPAKEPDLSVKPIEAVPQTMAPKDKPALEPIAEPKVESVKAQDETVVIEGDYYDDEDILSEPVKPTVEPVYDTEPETNYEEYDEIVEIPNEDESDYYEDPSEVSESDSDDKNIVQGVLNKCKTILPQKKEPTVIEEPNYMNLPYTPNMSDEDKRLLRVTYDPYYDDVLPEVNRKFGQVPKDVLLKIGGVIILLIVLLIYLINSI